MGSSLLVGAGTHSSHRKHARAPCGRLPPRGQPYNTTAVTSAPCFTPAPLIKTTNYWFTALLPFHAHSPSALYLLWSYIKFGCVLCKIMRIHYLKPYLRALLPRWAGVPLMASGDLQRHATHTHKLAGLFGRVARSKTGFPFRHETTEGEKTRGGPFLFSNRMASWLGGAVESTSGFTSTTGSQYLRRTRTLRHTIQHTPT